MIENVPMFDPGPEDVNVRRQRTINQYDALAEAIRQAQVRAVDLGEDDVAAVLIAARTQVERMVMSMTYKHQLAVG
jgi:hypothetical protein